MYAYYEETKFLVQFGFMRWSGFDRCGETSSSTKIKPATKYYVGSFSSYYYYSDVVGCFQTKSTVQRRDFGPLDAKDIFILWL